MPDSIEERLSALFPGITKDRYMARDVMPRIPQTGGQLSQRHIDERYKGYSFDPLTGKHTREQPENILAKLNQMAQQRSATRMGLEEKNRDKILNAIREKGLRDSYAELYGGERFEGAPAGMLGTLYGTARGMEREEEARTALEEQRAQEQAQRLGYAQQVLDQLPAYVRSRITPEQIAGMGEFMDDYVNQLVDQSERHEEESAKQEQRQAIIGIMEKAASDPVSAQHELQMTLASEGMQAPVAAEQAAQMIAQYMEVSKQTQATEQAEAKTADKERRSTFGRAGQSLRKVYTTAPKVGISQATGEAAKVASMGGMGSLEISDEARANTNQQKVGLLRGAISDLLQAGVTMGAIDAYFRRSPGGRPATAGRAQDFLSHAADSFAAGRSPSGKEERGLTSMRVMSGEIPLEELKSEEFGRYLDRIAQELEYLTMYSTRR